MNSYGQSSTDSERGGSMERAGTDSSSAEMGSPSVSESSATAAPCDSETDRTQTDEDLPPGWEKHEGPLGKHFAITFEGNTQRFIYSRVATDDDGPYYWHIKSGTIQREPPENKDSSSQPAMNFQRQLVRETEVKRRSFVIATTGSIKP